MSTKRKQVVISEPIIARPGDVISSLSISPAPGYTGSGIKIVNSGYAHGGFATVGDCSFSGLDTAIEIVGKVDSSRIHRCDFDNVTNGIITAAGAVWRESWVTYCHWYTCTNGIIIDGSTTVGDNHNQITIISPHMSWVDRPLTIVNQRPDRPMRRIRVLGGMLHGPQLDGTAPLILIEGYVRDLRIMDSDINNGATGYPGIDIIGGNTGVPDPIGITIDVGSANMRGDGIRVLRGRQVTLTGNLNGIAGVPVTVDPSAQVHNNVSVWP